MTDITLSDLALVLESGSRPKGGATADTGTEPPLPLIPSIGGEHLDGDGGFRLEALKRISPEFYHSMKCGRLAKGDILIVKDGATTGKVALVDSDFPFEAAAINEHVFRLVVDHKIADPRYVFQFLRSAEGQRQILSDFRGATVGGIGRSFLNRVRFKLPALEEQRRIASILRGADDLIKTQRSYLAHLDLLGEAVFLEMFGDPTTNPKNWEFSNVGSLLAFQQYGPRFYNETYSENGIRIARITDLSASGELDFASMPRLLLSDEDVRKYQLQVGDVIFARSGATVGKVGLIKDGSPPCIAGAYFITMRFNASVHPTYARYVLTAASMQDIVQRRSRQAAQQNFSGPGLRELPMPLPPLDLQTNFAGVIGAIDSLKTANRLRMSKLDALLAALRGSLLCAA
jgi:type I restriction enzyme S subunit